MHPRPPLCTSIPTQNWNQYSLNTITINNLITKYCNIEHFIFQPMRMQIAVINPKLYSIMLMHDKQKSCILGVLYYI